MMDGLVDWLIDWLHHGVSTFLPTAEITSLLNEQIEDKARAFSLPACVFLCWLAGWLSRLLVSLSRSDMLLCSLNYLLAYSLTFLLLIAYCLLRASWASTPTKGSLKLFVCWLLLFLVFRIIHEFLFTEFFCFPVLFSPVFPGCASRLELVPNANAEENESRRNEVVKLFEFIWFNSRVHGDIN